MCGRAYYIFCMWHHIRDAGSCPSSFTSDLALCLWQERMAEVHGSLHPCGRLGKISWLQIGLTLVIWEVNQLMEGLSVCHSTFQRHSSWLVFKLAYAFSERKQTPHPEALELRCLELEEAKLRSAKHQATSPWGAPPRPANP